LRRCWGGGGVTLRGVGRVKREGKPGEGVVLGIVDVQSGRWERGRGRAIQGDWGVVCRPTGKRGILGEGGEGLADQ